jgi:predicted RNA-binding protein with PUA-like domain
MLKISPKQEKMRQFIYTKNNQDVIYKIIKLFLVKNYLNRMSLFDKCFFFHSSTKTRSICLLTGRSRSVYRFFKMTFEETTQIKSFFKNLL